MKSQPVIELKNIKKCYEGDIPVIYDCNLSIERGEFVTLLGPSGCGKTTLLRMLAGFEMPTEGEIYLDGKDISDLSPDKRKINTVFQRYALFPHLNIYENIAFGLKEKKVPKDEIDRKVKKVLEVVDLEGFEKRKISSLSGGQQQRIAIARAIVNEPEILLLDEPLSALDYKMRQEMQLELKTMHKELGITFVFVTHDQEEALTMSDKIVVMSEGIIQQMGTPEEIYNHPANAFVADFIGQSNIFNGVKKAEGIVEFAGHNFECKDASKVGSKIDIVIRPEDVVLTKPEEGALQGEVISSIFKGMYYEIIIQCDKFEIEAQSLNHMEEGTQVGINFTPETIHTMPSDAMENQFQGVVDAENNLQLVDGAVPVVGAEYEEGTELSFYFDPSRAKLSDNPEEGLFVGNIVSIIYRADHYNYRVLSKNKEEYSVDDEYLWNQDDYVSVVIPEDAMEFKPV